MTVKDIFFIAVSISIIVRIIVLRDPIDSTNVIVKRQENETNFIFVSFYLHMKLSTLKFKE